MMQGSSTRLSSRPWTALLLAAGAAALFGCSGQSMSASTDELESSGADEQAGQRESAITGPEVFVSDFSAVVEISTNVGICSAVKISPNRYLTAAHCVSTTTTSLVMRPNADGTGGGNFTLTKLVIHPSYTRRAVFGPATQRWYDVAVFDIAQTNLNAQATLPGAAAVPVGTKGVVVGYGENDLNPGAFGRRQRADFTVFAPTSLTSNVHYFETQGTSTNNTEVGNGDSGGGFFQSVSSLTVRGIISYDSEAAYSAQDPSVNVSGFVRLGNILDWINDPQPDSTTALLVDQSPLKFMNPKSTGTAPLLQCISARGRGVANTDILLDECDGPNGDITRNPPGWRLSKVSTGVFNIINRFNGQCLSVANPATSPPANNTALVLANCDNATNPTQRWQFQTSPTLAIKNVNGGKCIGTDRGSVAQGTSVRLVSCGGGATPEQGWLWLH